MEGNPKIPHRNYIINQGTFYSILLEIKKFILDSSVELKHPM